MVATRGSRRHLNCGRVDCRELAARDLDRLGLLGIGIGELINHAPRRRAGIRIDSHPRSPKFFGIILDIGGSAVLLAGFYKLLAG